MNRHDPIGLSGCCHPAHDEGNDQGGDHGNDDEDHDQLADARAPLEARHLLVGQLLLVRIPRHQVERYRCHAHIPAWQIEHTFD